MEFTGGVRKPDTNGSRSHFKVSGISRFRVSGVSITIPEMSGIIRLLKLTPEA